MTVCRISSLFVQLTFVPIETFRGVGSNLNILTFTERAVSSGEDDGVPPLDRVGFALDVESLPHAVEMTTAVVIKQAIGARTRSDGKRNVVT